MPQICENLVKMAASILEETGEEPNILELTGGDDGGIDPDILAEYPNIICNICIEFDKEFDM